MQKLPFRTVISDLDGTLLNGQHTLGECTISTLSELAKKQVNIILATGRNHVDVASLLGKLNISNALMITSNGARVQDLQGNLIYHNLLEPQLAFDIMNIEFDRKKVCVNTYQNNDWFINIDVPEIAKYHQDSGFMYKVVDFKQHYGEGTEKVFFIGRTSADLLPIEQELKQRFGAQIATTFSSPLCLEVMNKNVSKGATLVHIVAQKDYQLADCIAFGDGMNDAEMLSIVGKGCIMANADPRLKAACPQLEQIGSNKEEAVAHYLRQTFGIK